MAQLSSAIPAFYRVFFTSIDPLIALSAVYLNFFDPNTFMTSIFPPSHKWSVIAPSHTLLMHQAGGAFIMMAFLMVFMLRYTKDVGVWKFFQAGILITDFTLFYSNFVALSAQGRLHVGQLRWEEWSTFAITGFVTVVRTAFLLGVGFAQTNAGQMKKA